MIKPLTSLRFIFAFMVFAHHLIFLNSSESNISKYIYNSFFYEGYIGVSFFFILSGFILTYSYQNKFLNKQITRKAFYIARLARIYPLHILTLLIYLPLSFKIFFENTRLWIFQILANMTLTHSIFPYKTIYFAFNSPSWSISNEMFFYLVFPFLIFLLNGKYKEKINYVLLLFIISIPLLTLIVPEEIYHQIFYISPLTRIADFIIGMMLFKLYSRFLKKSSLLQYNILEITSILLLIIFISFHKWIPDVARYSFYYWIPMSYIIFSFSFQGGMISKFLSKRIFIYLGEISFGFYMLHQIGIKGVKFINEKFLLFTDFQAVIIMFLIALLLSHFSFIWFETPMNKYLKKTLNK